MKQDSTGSYWGGIIKALGLVFDDIGTSPIYTLTVIVTLTKPSQESIYGILSLIVWTLIILVTIEYAWLAMGLGRKGEGGTIVLREILVKLLKQGRQLAVVTFLAYVGICLLIGDGVITPAISILSAVEGLELIPGLEHTPSAVLILIASIIAVGLFFFQNKGTDKVAAAFGPIMVLWFLALSVFGIISIVDRPAVIKALSPWYAASFLWNNGLAALCHYQAPDPQLRPVQPAVRCQAAGGGDKGGDVGRVTITGSNIGSGSDAALFVCVAFDGAICYKQSLLQKSKKSPPP